MLTRRGFVQTGAAAICGGILSRAGALSQPTLTHTQQREIDGLFLPAGSAPGYAVGIVRNGEFALAKGYGLANLDDGVPITPETSFHLASVSKQFTASAIALLIFDGKLTLEDPVLKVHP